MRKSAGIIVGVLIAFCMIAIAHAVVYEALISVLTVLLLAPLSHAVSETVMGVFIFLAVSFIAATFISMKFNNPATRVFYRFAAVWAGLAIYLFLAAFIYGVLYMIPALTSTLVSIVVVSWIGAALMTLALVVGIYGVFRAGHIRVTTVSVPLPNMPPQWKNRRAVWVSDVHLGQVRGECFARSVAEKVLALSPDIVFVGGDLYDGAKVDAAVVIEPLRKLTSAKAVSQKAVPLGVYFVMGNHEEFNADDKARYARAVRDIGMRILEDEHVTVDGVDIVGVDHGHAEDPREFAAVLDKIKSRGGLGQHMPAILLKHEPRDLDVAAAAGVSFQISGHTHRGQIFPVSILTRIIYKGHDYGLKGFKNMQVYTSSGVGTWGPPLRVGTRSEIVLFTFK